MLRSALSFVVRWRAFVMVVVAIVSAVALWSASRVQFDSDIELWFLPDDPELATYHDFLETFETDEIVVLGVFTDDVFAPEVLASIEALTTALQQVPRVHRVRSLTNASHLEGRQDVLAVVPIVPVLPISAEEAQQVRRTALADPLIAGALVSEDAKATAIVVELSTEADSFERKVELVRGLKQAAADHPPPAGARLRMAGTPAINEAVFRYSRRDFTVLGSVAIVLVLLITFIMFRQTSATVLPLIVVALSVSWLFGLMGALGLNINLVSQSLFVVIFAVGIADSIHVLSEYQHQLVAGLNPKEAVVEALLSVALPCLFTTITTAAGMLSLTASSLAPLREFGVLAAAGVSFALLLSFTFLPAALSWLHPPAHAFLARQQEGPMARALRWTAMLTRNRRWRILSTFSFLVAGSLFLIPQLQVGANPAAYFKYNDPVRQDMRAIDAALSGSTSIELLVTSEEPGLLIPARVARIAELETWLEALPSVARVASITDGLEAISRAMTDEARLPDSPAALAQSYLLLEEEPEFGSLITQDYQKARISARVRMSEAAALVAEIPRIESKLAAEYSGADLRVRPTGFVKLISEMEIYIVDSQVRSFLLAFGLISVLMILLLRSVRLGLFAMIPNLGPVIVGLAIMQLARIRLDPGTAMLGSLTLGLVVDDTVHMTTRIKHHLSRGLAIEAAITAAITEVGRALTATSAILAAGFGVLALGSFTPNIYLGVMAAVVIGLALVADLVVLPAALARPKARPARR